MTCSWTFWFFIPNGVFPYKDFYEVSIYVYLMCLCLCQLFLYLPLMLYCLFKVMGEFNRLKAILHVRSNIHMIHSWSMEWKWMNIAPLIGTRSPWNGDAQCMRSSLKNQSIHFIIIIILTKKGISQFSCLNIVPKPLCLIVTILISLPSQNTFTVNLHPGVLVWNHPSVLTALPPTLQFSLNIFPANSHQQGLWIVLSDSKR